MYTTKPHVNQRHACMQQVHTHKAQHRSDCVHTTKPNTCQTDGVHTTKPDTGQTDSVHTTGQTIIIQTVYIGTQSPTQI